MVNEPILEWYIITLKVSIKVYLIQILNSFPEPLQLEFSSIRRNIYKKILFSFLEHSIVIMNNIKFIFPLWQCHIVNVENNKIYQKHQQKILIRPFDAQIGAGASIKIQFFFMFFFSAKWSRKSPNILLYDTTPFFIPKVNIIAGAGTWLRIAGGKKISLKLPGKPF